ncbi:MAG: sporulation protein YhbH [Ethanoligenens sp.]
MAVFRESNPLHHDRAAEDRRRHRQLVEDSIKKNLPDILSEEAIIGQSKNRKIKIPIRGMKEYEFVYGGGGKGVGSGSGSEKRGDKVGSDKSSQRNGAGKAGSEEGEDIYETELTIEEIISYLFEDLHLPYLDRKRLSEVWTEHARKKSGYQSKGIPPRLAKKRSVIEKLKRKQGMKRALTEQGVRKKIVRFPFKEDDIKYYRMHVTKKRESNAVVFCIMDASGSMDQTKKYLARSFYFLMVRFVKLRYIHVDVVFIAHSTVAKEVSEAEFFHKVESGGTYMSSGYKLALELIEQRYNPTYWNIYAFHASDGDNWTDDNERAVQAAKALCDISNLFGYIEISPGTYESTMRRLYSSRIKKQNFALGRISQKEDVWPTFKNVLQSDRKEGG